MTKDNTKGNIMNVTIRHFDSVSILGDLSLEQLENFNEEYRQDSKNLLAQSACCQQTLTDVLANRKIRFSSLHVFNTKV